MIKISKYKNLSIAAFIILLLFCSTFLCLIPTAHASTFGNSAIGSSNDWGGSYAVGCRFVTPSDMGTLTLVSLYSRDSAGENGRIVVCADNSGVPGDLVVTGPEFAFGTTNAWIDSEFSQSLSVNTAYWFFVVADTSWDTVYLYETAGSTNQQAYAQPVSYPTVPSSMNGYRNYAVAMYMTYTPTVAQVATPTFSPSAGTYSSAQSVEISCATNGATIRYTIDGTDPTSSSTLYSGEITVSSTETIKAKAFKDEMTDSSIASATYTISATFGNSAIGSSNDWGGSYAVGCRFVTPSDMGTLTLVSLYSRDSAGENGRIVVCADNSGVPGDLVVTGPEFAFGTTNAWIDSEFSQSLSVNTAYWFFVVADTSWDTVYLYETAGSTNQQAYAQPVSYPTVPSSMNGYRNYAVAMYMTYTPTVAQVATPTFSPSAGTYSSAQSVEISCATNGATIRYTIDGTDPTSSSTLYSGEITVSSTETIKAKAFKDEMTDSSIASATYTIQMSSNSFNGLWTDAGDAVNASQCAIYASHNMTDIYMKTGYWTNDNSIMYYDDETGINTAIANAHAAGLKIYAWVTSQTTEGGTIDLSTGGKRATAIANLEDLITTYSFDGVADDVENWDWSSYDNLIAYFNASTVALNAEGKEYFTAIIPCWAEDMGSELFASITVDRILPMMYGGYPNNETGPNGYKTYIDEALNWSTSPVSFAMRAEKSLYFPFRPGDGPLTFADVLVWYDEQLAITGTTNLAGFNIFWASDMTSGQWTAWDNWATKNGS